MPNDAASLIRGAPGTAAARALPPLVGPPPSGSWISLVVMRSKMACSSASGRICGQPLDEELMH